MVNGIDAGYGGVQILHQVSMTARTGDVTCIFGPNGCGKSTLLKAMVGVIDPWAGSDHDRRRRSHPSAVASHPRPRARDDAAGRRRVPSAVGPRQPAYRRLYDPLPEAAGPADRGATGRVPAAARAVCRAGRPAVRRRADDPVDRPRARLAPTVPAVRRAVRRPVPQARRRRPGPRRRARPTRRGRDHDRAEHPRGVAGGRPDVRPGGGAEPVRRHTRRRGRRPRAHAPLSRGLAERCTAIDPQPARATREE